VEPVENVLRIRVEILRKCAHRITPIREEGHLLVRLHTLGLQQIEEPALGLLVETSHQRKAFARSGHIFTVVTAEGENTFAGDHLKHVYHLRSGRASPRAHNPAVQPDRQRAVGDWQTILIGLRAFHKHGLFCAHRLLVAPRRPQRMVTHADLAMLLVERRHLVE